MTFEQLLVKYFYQHKKVSLQGLGTITLASSVPDAETIHKNRYIKVEGISFDYNLKSNTDEAFISFFAQQRGKIKPLAESDIESHLQLVRQLINIGNPYEVAGMGSFEKQNNGSVQLTPGYYVVPTADGVGQPGKLKERADIPDKRRIDEEEPSGGISANTKKLLVAVLAVLILIVAGWFVWGFIANKSSETNVSAVSGDSNQAVVDTPVVIKDSSVPSTPVQATSSSGVVQWKAYFRHITDKQDALKKFKFYVGNPTVKMETSDSVSFHLYVQFESAVADTAFKRDSLRKFFARPVTLERVGQ